MKTHSLNCATFCPPCRAAVNGKGSYFERGTLVCHCLLVETPSDGLVLIDTGLGTADLNSPSRRLGTSFLASSNPLLDLEESALHQIQALGYQASDVRHILITHLDLDHAGGLSDFPGATVHLLHDEKVAAETSKDSLSRSRYRPQQWSHVRRWQTYSANEGETWRGLQNTQKIVGLKSDLLLVPLQGHTLGHAGYASESKDGAWMHCGDAYFHAASVKRGGNLQSPPWGLNLFQNLVATRRRQMHETQSKIRSFIQTTDAESAGISVFCAHDPEEFAEQKAKSHPLSNDS